MSNYLSTYECPHCGYDKQAPSYSKIREGILDVLLKPNATLYNCKCYKCEKSWYEEHNYMPLRAKIWVSKDDWEGDFMQRMKRKEIKEKEIEEGKF